MAKIQEIVPVNIKSDQVKQQTSGKSHSIKPKIALRVKRDEMDLIFYNGCDKYILYTVLKELNLYDH